MERLAGLPASIIATKLREDGILVSGSDLEFLDFINKQDKPLSEKEISEKAKLSPEVVQYMIKRLNSRDYIKHTSPEWIVSPCGKKLLKKAYSVMNKTMRFIDADTYLHILSNTAKPFIEY